MQGTSDPVAISEATAVTLHSAPTADALQEIGIYGTAPFRRLVPAEAFTVTLHANVGGYALNAFQVKLFYNASVLEFERFIQAGSFMCATDFCDPPEHTCSFMLCNN